MLEAAPSLSTRYPSAWRGTKHISRMIRNCLLSEEMCVEYASYFEGKSEQELEAFARSFALENCVQRKRLNEILTEASKRPPD